MGAAGARALASGLAPAHNRPGRIEFFLVVALEAHGLWPARIQGALAITVAQNAARGLEDLRLQRGGKSFGPIESSVLEGPGDLEFHLWRTSRR